MRIISWNVNGLRACAKKGFLDFLHEARADVVALQEVRAFPEQLPDDVREPPGWHTYFSPAVSINCSNKSDWPPIATTRQPFSLAVCCNV